MTDISGDNADAPIERTKTVNIRIALWLTEYIILVLAHSFS